MPAEKLGGRGGKLRVADVRKKYPEFFATVEAAVRDDCVNAAAVATLELHKIIIARQNKCNRQARSTNSDYAAALKTIITPWCIAHGSFASSNSIHYLARKIQRLNASTQRV